MPKHRSGVLRSRGCTWPLQANDPLQAGLGSKNWATNAGQGPDLATAKHASRCPTGSKGLRAPRQVSFPKALRSVLQANPTSALTRTSLSRPACVSKLAGPHLHDRARSHKLERARLHWQEHACTSTIARENLHEKLNISFQAAQGIEPGAKTGACSAFCGSRANLYGIGVINV